MENAGVLTASGLIAGEAILGLVWAGLQFPPPGRDLRFSNPSYVAGIAVMMLWRFDGSAPHFGAGDPKEPARRRHDVISKRVARGAPPANPGKGSTEVRRTKNVSHSFGTFVSWVVLFYPCRRREHCCRPRTNECCGQAAGRNVDDVTLMAVSKPFHQSSFAQCTCGSTSVRENRVQEFAEKVAALRDLSDAEWHISAICRHKAARRLSYSPPSTRSTPTLAQKLTPRHNKCESLQS